jgi:hypothetical protein
MISHRKKFIFVHINKTAGTSIMKALAEYSDSGKGQKHEMLYRILPSDGFSNKSGLNLISQCKQSPKKYFKFAFVRNPWDRAVSGFKYQVLKRGKYTKNFNRYLQVHTNIPFLSSHNQLDWITNEKNEVKLDFIGRFENLQEDFNIICDKIGIPKQQLPHKNKSKHKSYTEYYDDETRQIVAEKYAKDIEYFGYEFGE